MGYPTGIVSFTTKNAGDTIQPAHVNDLQTEVAAVETGLLNGLQHAFTISTGGFTVSTGSVNIGGPSSVATLQVNGGSTLAGLLTLTAQPRAALKRTSTQSIADAAWTDVAGFDTEDIDVGALHSTSVNPERITIPAGSSGAYWFWGQVDFDQSSVGMRGVRFFKNSTTFMATRQHGAVSGNKTITGTEHLVVMDGGDFMTLQANQASGSTLSFGGSALTLFGAMRIG